MIDDSELRFTGRVFVYHGDELTTDEKSELHKIANRQGIGLVLRGPRYASERSATEKPLAFISHDSRDKDDIARPLAIELSTKMCPVWFDAFALNVGDSLRENIERGIKECMKCILVLSPNFLSNSGWTKREFNSIFTREIIENDRLILPVWHNVTKQQVFDYSPSLADTLAASWTLGVQEVGRRLRKAIL